MFLKQQNLFIFKLFFKPNLNQFSEYFKVLGAVQSSKQSQDSRFRAIRAADTFRSLGGMCVQET